MFAGIKRNIRCSSAIAKRRSKAIGEGAISSSSFAGISLDIILRFTKEDIVRTEGFIFAEICRIMFRKLRTT